MPLKTPRLPSFEALLHELEGFALAVQELSASAAHVKRWAWLSAEVESWWEHCCAQDRRQALLAALEAIPWRWVKRFPLMRLRLGYLWLDEDRLTEAAEAFSSLSKMPTSKVSMLAFRGLRYIELKRSDYKHAKRQLERLFQRQDLRVQPERAGLLEVWLKLLLWLGELDETKRWFELYAASFAQDSETAQMELSYLGAIIHGLCGDLTLEQHYFERTYALASRLRPPQVVASIYVGESITQLERGDFERALMKAMSAVALDDQSAKLYNISRSAMILASASFIGLQRPSEALARLKQWAPRLNLGALQPPLNALLEGLIREDRALSVKALEELRGADDLSLVSPLLKVALTQALLQPSPPTCASLIRARVELQRALSDATIHPIDLALIGAWGQQALEQSPLWRLAFNDAKALWRRNDPEDEQLWRLLEQLERAWRGQHSAPIKLKGMWAAQDHLWGWLAHAHELWLQGHNARAESLLMLWVQGSPQEVEQVLAFWRGACLSAQSSFAAWIGEHMELITSWKVKEKRIWVRESGRIYTLHAAHQLDTKHVTTHLFHALVERGEGWEKAELYEHVWQLPYLGLSTDRVIYTSVARLRERLRAAGVEDDMIKLDKQGRYQALDYIIVDA